MTDSAGVIVTVTLNAALHVSYAVGAPGGQDGFQGSGQGGGQGSGQGSGDDSGQGGDGGGGPVRPVSLPGYRAGGRGVTAARVLHAFGHDVLAAGLVGGTSGELIKEDLARSGVPTAFTGIRGESRRLFRFAPADRAGEVLRFGEPGPYITTEELGRFAADYRRLLPGAAAVVLCGSLPDGLPTDIYGSLVTYAAEAGVPVILDAGGEELGHAVSHGPDLVVVRADRGPGRGLGAALIRRGAAAAAVIAGQAVLAITATGEWTARITPTDPGCQLARAALVAGLVPGQVLGWSWPDRLRHALALAVGGTTPAGATPAGNGPAGNGPAGATPASATPASATPAGNAGNGPAYNGAARNGSDDGYRVDLAAYERLVDLVTVEPSVGLSCTA